MLSSTISEPIEFLIVRSVVSSPSEGFGSFDFFNEGGTSTPETVKETITEENSGVQSEVILQGEAEVNTAQENGQVDLMQSAPAESPDIEPETKSEEKVNDGEVIQQGKTDNTGDAAKADDKDGGKVSNPFDAAMAKADEAQAQDKKSSLIDKLPVFDYSGAKEDIVDTYEEFVSRRNEKISRAVARTIFTCVFICKSSFKRALSCGMSFMHHLFKMHIN